MLSKLKLDLGLPSLDFSLWTSGLKVAWGCWEYVWEHKLIVGAATATVGVYGLWFFHRPRGMPPGPLGYPLVGSLFSIGMLEHLSMMEIAKKYGDVFTLWFGWNRYHVVLNSYDVAKEALVTRGATYQHRIPDDLVPLFGVTDEIVCAGTVPKVNEVRKRAMAAIRNTATDGRWNQSLGAEVEFMFNFLSLHEGEPIDVEELFREACTQHQLLLLFGRKTCRDHSQPDNKQFIQNLVDIFEKGTALYFMCKNLPYPVKYITNFLNKRIATSMNEPILELIRCNIQHNLKILDKDNITNICDAYLAAGQLEEVGLNQLARNLFFFLPDAVYSCACLLKLCIMHLVKYPEYQQKLYEEITDIVGPCTDSIYVRLNDKGKLPLTRGFLEEVLRVVSFANVGMGQIALEDTTFRGFRIPKRTPIYINAYAINRDPARFSDPDKFYPERFLEDESLAAVAFLIGRRSCIGESLMRNLMFHFLANLVKFYTFELAPGELLPDADDYFGYFLKYKFVVRKRK